MRSKPDPTKAKRYDMTKTLKIMMAASLLLTGAQAFAAEGDSQEQRAEAQASAPAQAEQGGVQVCFDHPERFQSRKHYDKGFYRPGQLFDSRPGKFESRL